MLAWYKDLSLGFILISIDLNLQTHANVYVGAWNWAPIMGSHDVYTYMGLEFGL